METQTNNSNSTYQPPCIEVIEVTIEVGFAGSTTSGGTLTPPGHSDIEGEW